MTTQERIAEAVSKALAAHCQYIHRRLEQTSPGARFKTLNRVMANVRDEFPDVSDSMWAKCCTQVRKDMDASKP